MNYYKVNLILWNKYNYKPTPLGGSVTAKSRGDAINQVVCSHLKKIYANQPESTDECYIQEEWIPTGWDVLDTYWDDEEEMHMADLYSHTLDNSMFSLDLDWLNEAVWVVGEDELLRIKGYALLPIDGVR